MKRIPARRAALAAAALVLSSIVPGFGSAASAADPGVTVTGTIRNSAGTGLEGDLALLDGTGAHVADSGTGGDGAFTLAAPPGHYSLHFEAPTRGYSDGFKSGDDAAPGLFLDVPLDVTGDATLDLTVPIVDFPVHVVDRAGNPVPGVLVEGESDAQPEVAPGLAAAGRLRNQNAVWTDSHGDGTLQIFAGAPPAAMAVSDGYMTLGRVSPAPSDTSAIVVLDNPVLQGDLLDPRGPLPGAAAANTWVAFVGGTAAGQFAPWPYGTNGSYRLQADAGDHTLSVGNANVFEHDDGAVRPPSATLPGTWTFEAPYHLAGDTMLDLTIPDAAPADIVVLGADGQPVAGATLHYEAVALNPAELAPGVEANAVARDDITDVQGHFSPMLFGPSRITFSVDPGGAGAPLTIGPGDRVTVRLGDQSGKPGAPQNVTAAAGDGKVKVTWDAPAFDGGSPITGYTVTASRGGSNFKANFGPAATSGAIRGLVNGKDYTVTVVARNANGAGPASAAVTITLDAFDPPTTTTTAPPAPGPGGEPVGGAGAGDGSGPAHPGSGRSGYWLLGANGAVYPFGDAAPYGDASAALATPAPTAGSPAAAGRAVDVEPTPSGRGYWVLDNRGRVHPFGDAGHFGDAVPTRLAAGEEPASLSATPSGAGYWVFTNRGRALAFGDAAFLGDTTGTALNGPVLDSVATPSGRGYYMVASDGGIFAFGDARFAGSMGGRPLNKSIVGLTISQSGPGYWLIAADGGVFAFDAPFRGSMGGQRLNKPVRGMVRYGDGYLMVGEDGGVFAFSDRAFTGSLGSSPPAGPIVSVAALG
ncbi:MAG: hypothetical protein QOE80_3099 [Actinomycetota bacterium]|nr:hypothetical protein [Actinomycetota bacterium]